MILRDYSKILLMQQVNYITPSSNRSQNVSVTSVTPTWDPRLPDDSNENGYYKSCVDMIDCNNNVKGEDFVSTLDYERNTVNLSSFGVDKQMIQKTMETVQSNDHEISLSEKIGNRKNINGKIMKPRKEPKALMDQSYPYFSPNSISLTRPLIKSQSLGTIECPSLPSSAIKLNATVEPSKQQQLVPVASMSSLIPPRTAPSTSQSMFSFGSSTQGETNFRRYARSVTSSLSGIVDDSIDYEAKQRKMLKYRAELAAQKAEKTRREQEEKAKAQEEEEMAEKRMIAVQRRLKEEYELERRLIEEKRENAEKRRLAVIAVMEQQSNVRGSIKRNDTFQDLIPSRKSTSVSTQTDNHSYSHSSANQFNSNSSSSAQTDISLLFDLIRSLGFSTMTLKDLSSSDDDGDRCNEKRRPTVQRLSKTARPRLGRNGLKFDLNSSRTTTKINGIQTNLSKSVSHTNLNKTDKSELLGQERPINKLKSMSSSSSPKLDTGFKSLKEIINHKKQSTSNLPLINNNQQTVNPESIGIYHKRKFSKSTLNGIL